MPKSPKFRFRNLDSIGAAAAEDDVEFLKECFVDTGYLKPLEDCSDPRSVVIGRTGCGKSALLLRMAEAQERVLEIQAESLALAYISNSTILTFLTQLEVKLDIFFRLLWRHVFTVELLKRHFNIRKDADKKSFIDKIRTIFRSQKQSQALNYLEKWGSSFWKETEYRIKEITTQLEHDVKASVEQKIPGFSFDLGELDRLSAEEKAEIVQRTQAVVNQVQIRQLSDIIDLIDGVLDDRQKRYYLTIDRLDEDWIEDRLRFRLIRALIETVRDFRRVRNAKIVVAIRYDLLERVFRLTRDAGFQEEKYESLFLPIEWNRRDLITVLDNRVDYLIRRTYTKGAVSHRDILPKRVNRQAGIDYFLDRTMMRPRDVILFFNCCIQQAADKASITVQKLRAAEGEYSRLRLRSLADEWFADYPNLLKFSSLFKGRKKQFPARAMSQEEIGEFCLEFVVKRRWSDPKDSLSAEAERLVDCEQDWQEFQRTVLQVFYRVGLIGLKVDPHEAFTWAISSRRSVSRSEIGSETRVAVHPAFWRVLGNN